MVINESPLFAKYVFLIDLEFQKQIIELNKFVSLFKKKEFWTPIGAEGLQKLILILIDIKYFTFHP